MDDETAQILQDPELMESIRQSYEAEREGRVSTLEEVRDELVGDGSD